MPPVKISIPEPCTQSWNNMTLTEKGRYCASCEKEVIDFRTWTTDELTDWFLNYKGKVCGQFLREQIVVDGLLVKSSRLNLAKSMFVASCLTLFASSKAFSKSMVNTVYAENKASRFDLLATDLDADSLITVSGRVKDFKDKIDLLNVKVWMLNGQRTSTDAFGRFTMQVKVKKGSKLVLFFDYTGYPTKELILKPGETKELKIEIGDEKPIINVLGGAIVCVDVKKTYLPKRIWNFIKRPFVSRH